MVPWPRMATFLSFSPAMRLRQTSRSVQDRLAGTILGIVGHVLAAQQHTPGLEVEMDAALKEQGAGQVSAGRQHHRSSPGFGRGVYGGLNRRGVELCCRRRRRRSPGG